MQGLELPNPPLVATMILLPVHEQPLSPPHPPGPAHEFLEPKDTTGQARRMAAISSGTCVGQQIRSRVVSASASNTSGYSVVPVCDPRYSRIYNGAYFY